MKFNSTYRGYRIAIRRTDKLAALIWPPNFPRMISEIAYAELSEGEAVVIERARKIIDKDIEKELGD